MSEHLIADFFECDPNILSDSEFIEITLIKAVEVLGATMLEKCTKKYSPKGVTMVIVLAESHISIHTWPENGFAALDIYTCGDKTTRDTYEFLKAEFKPAESKAVIVNRGPEIRAGDFEISNLDTNCE